MYQLFRNTAASMELDRALQRIQRVAGSRRYQEMDALVRYYADTQHDGKTSWFATDSDTPPDDRKPCVRAQLPKAGTEKAVRFTFGEQKFPAIKFAEADKRTIGGIDFALSADDARKISTLWTSCATQLGLQMLMRDLLRDALISRTAVAVLYMRDGELLTERLEARYCKPEWADAQRKQLASLDCRYVFPREVVEDGTIKQRWFWYRRTITTSEDIVYRQVPVGDGDEPTWIPETVSEHGCGFVPACWMPNAKRLATGDDDGEALFETHIHDMLDRLDVLLSLRHTGAKVYGTPQGVEIGVSPGQGPDDDASDFTVDTMRRTDGTTETFYRRTDKKGRKRSAHSWWAYRQERVKALLLETTGGAHEMATKEVDRLSAILLRATSMVLTNPDEIAGHADMSAKLLELLHEPLLALVDDLREVWGRHLRGLVNLVLRFLVAQSRQGTNAIFVAGLDDALTSLTRHEVPIQPSAEDAEEVQRTRWIPLEIGLRWGAYFAPTPKDRSDDVAMVKALRAHNEGDGAEPMIQLKTALTAVKQHVGVSDVDAELSALEEERERRAKEAAEKMAQQNAQLHALMSDKDDDADPPAGSPAKGPPGKPAGSGAAGGPGPGSPSGSGAGGRANRGR